MENAGFQKDKQEKNPSRKKKKKSSTASLPKKRKETVLPIRNS